METIGLRELSHHTAKIARRVRDGATITVTDHGTPVMVLSPATTADDLFARLVAAGELSPAASTGPMPEPYPGNGTQVEDYIDDLREDRF